MDQRKSAQQRCAGAIVLTVLKLTVPITVAANPVDIICNTDGTTMPIRMNDVA
jgi:hypothetical protein